MAATKAWKRLPAKGDMSSSFTKIKQEPDEPFSDFVHRQWLQEGFLEMLIQVPILLNS